MAAHTCRNWADKQTDGQSEKTKHHTAIDGLEFDNGPDRKAYKLTDIIHTYIHTDRHLRTRARILRMHAYRQWESKPGRQTEKANVGEHTQRQRTKLRRDGVSKRNGNNTASTITDRTSSQTDRQTDVHTDEQTTDKHEDRHKTTDVQTKKV